MATKTWLAVALACLVWFAYLKWFSPVPTQQSTAQKQPISVENEKSGYQKEISNENSGSEATPFRLSFVENNVQILKNEKLEVAFTSSGAKPYSAKVLTYKKTIHKDSPFIETISLDESEFSMATLFTDRKLMVFSNGVYEAKKEGLQKITLQKTEENIAITKTYEISPGSYYVKGNLFIRFPAGKKDWGHLLIPLGGKGLVFDQNSPLKSWESVAYQDGKVIRKKYDSIEKEEEISQGVTKWLAFGNRYFTSVVSLDNSDLNPDVIFSKQPTFTGAYLKFPLVLKEGQTALEFSFSYFIGPKEISELSKIEGLTKIIDFGMWSFLAYPLLAIMKFFYSVINNWGIAIILLTILVRIIFYPLSLKSYKSMKAMQKIQPQIKALKEKYKEDMQKFNQEQMALFKSHKINPFGGCLPILVQLPVFIALYSVLSNAIELFHSPFFGWIKDLSEKDPYYIYPVLMGVTMFIQQKMTPMGGMDPMQQKIMLIMPVVFSIIMLNLPSGLTVYIFLSTLLGIAQQWSINRSPAPKLVVSSEKASK